MNFKKPKEDVLQDIKYNTQNAIYNHLQNNLGGAMKVDTSNLVWVLKEAISMGIEEGFRTMLDNQYTDDDFERDLTLKS